LKVSGFEFRVPGLGTCRDDRSPDEDGRPVSGEPMVSGFRVGGLGSCFWFQGIGFRLQGSGLKFSGLG